MKTIRIRKDLGSKKVGVLKELPSTSASEPNVNAWLKPGDKLKTDNHPDTSYDLIMSDTLYQKVYYNGQEGWLIDSAIER